MNQQMKDAYGKYFNLRNEINGGRVSGTMEGRQLDKPANPHNIYVVPEFCREPDIDKLGKIFMVLANSLTKRRTN